MTLRNCLAAVLAILTTATPIGAQPGVGEGVPIFSPVTWERLVSAADEPQNWSMYNGMLDSKRFSSLDQIDRGNVDDLELK